MEQVFRKIPAILLLIGQVVISNCRKFSDEKDKISVSPGNCVANNLQRFSLSSTPVSAAKLAMAGCAVLSGDATPPLVAAVPAGGKFGQPVTVRMTVNETASVYFTTNGSTATDASTVYNAGLPPVLSGNSSLAYIAKDTAGNFSPAFSGDFEFETGLPTVTIIQVSSYHTGINAIDVNNQNTLKIDFSVDKAVSYSLEIAQAGKGTGQIQTLGNYTTGTLTLNVPGAALQDGLNYLYLSVIDANGKEGYALLKIFRNDSYTITKSDTDSGTYSAGIWVTLASENISRIYYTTDGSAPTTASAVYTTALYFSTDSTIRYFSIDTAGNSEPVRTLDFSFDFTAPVVTIVVPAALTDSISNGGGGPTQSELRFSATETGQYQIEAGGTGKGTGTVLFTGTYAVAATEEILQVQAAQLIEGSNSIYVYLTDGAGNVGSAAYTILVDSVAKTPVVFAPGRNSMFSSLPILVKWTDPSLDATEVSGLGSYVLQVSTTDDFTAPVINQTGLATNTYNITAGLANGSYFLRVRFIDGIGNLSAFSAPVKFRLGKSPKDLNGDGFSDFAVGSPLYDTGHSTLIENGKVYVYFGATTLSAVPALVINSSYSNERLGNSAAILNDMNGDGYADLAVGAVHHSSGLIQRGRVYLFYGGSSLDAKCAAYHTCTLNAASADLILDGEKSGELFGWQVRDAGDVNGDNFSDLAVSGRQYDASTGTNVGRVYIYAGAGTPGATPVQTLTGAIEFEEAGYDLASGDMNADGYDDLVVGAPFQNADISGTTYFNTGMVRLFAGAATSPLASQLIALNLAGNNNMMGYSLSGGIDVNQDGFPDLLNGGSQSSRFTSNGGHAQLYFGGLTGAATDINYYPVSSLSATPSADMFEGVANDQFGNSVSLLGDVNADGYAEWIICAPFSAASGFSASGRCYLYNYSGGTVTLLSAVNGLAANDNLGAMVRRAGDINGDGNADFIISAPRKEIGANANCGQVTVFLGGGGFSLASPALTLSGEGAHSYFGQALSGE